MSDRYDGLDALVGQKIKAISLDKNSDLLGYYGGSIVLKSRRRDSGTA